MTSRRSAAWRGFRSILCGVDFSGDSSLALRYAAVLALRRKKKASLTTLYVNDPFLVAAASAALHDERIAEASLRELRRFTKAHLPAAVRDRVVPHEMIAVGAPAQAILEAARAERSDLIVLGTAGLTGARRWFLGSTTLSVLERTTVPVLTIPRIISTGDRGDRRPRRSWPGPTIMVAAEIDSSTGAEIAVASKLAEWFGSSLLVVHVVEPPAAPRWLIADLASNQRARQRSAERRLNAAVARAAGDVPCEVRVVAGRVADQLRAFADAAGIQLVVTLLRERHGWFGAKRGSVSYDVLTHGATPVLAVPRHWRPR